MPFFDLIIQRAESSDFGPKSDDLGHRILKSDFILSDFCKTRLHKQAHPFFRLKNINEKLGIRSHNVRPHAAEKVPFRYGISLSDRGIRSAHPVEKVDNGMRGSDFTFSTGCADRIARSKTFLEPTASLATPQNARSQPYNSSSDAGLTSAAAAAVLAWSTLDEVQRHNCDDEADDGSPRAKRTLCSRKRRDKDVCLSTANS